MSGERDIYNNLKLTEVLAAAAPGIGETSTSELDTEGFGSHIIAVSSVALAAGTFKLQHSDTSGGTFTDCAAEDVLGTQGVALANGEAVKLGYVGGKRYVIAVVDLSADGVVSAVAIQGNAEICPVG